MYMALQQHWKAVPPPAIQLRRIASVLGIKPDAAQGFTTRPVHASAPTSHDDAVMAVASAGFQVLDGRPKDPMFDLIPTTPTTEPHHGQ